MLLDLDDFKAIDDSLGHEQGDAILLLTGRLQASIGVSIFPDDADAAMYGAKRQHVQICLYREGVPR